MAEEQLHAGYRQGHRTIVELRDVLRRFQGQTQPAVDHASLSVEQGEILSLVGESGCGKTTTLRMIAGFETPDAGLVRIAGRPVAAAGFSVAPNRRPTGIVFQEHALFPHKTVESNIAFGLRGWARPERRRRVGDLLRLAALEGLERRYPHELSGGQAQRVALARAIAPKPEVILLDEPFNNLDSGLRFRLLRDVEALVRAEGATAILVTHDWQEAFAVSDRIAVMNRGRVLQVGTPREVYEQPRSRFVAEFFGPVNELPAARPASAESATAPAGSAEPPAGPAEPPPAEHCIRPRDVLVCRGTQCPYPNCLAFQGTVERTRFLGEYQEVVCRLSGDAVMRGTASSAPSEEEYVITAYAPAHLALGAGETVVAACPEARLLHFDGDFEEDFDRDSDGDDEHGIP